MIQELAAIGLGLLVATALTGIGWIVQWVGTPPHPVSCASCAIERMDRTEAPLDVVNR